MDGTIISAENQKPIEFVNIGILNKNQGTITNPNGKFILTIPKKFATDSITISHINYYSVNILAENFSNRIIALKPKTTELSEVVVTNKRKKSRKIGVKSFSRLLSMRVIAENNDIIEAAQRINIPSREIKVNAVNFAIRKWSKTKNVKVRVNFYENKDNAPGKKIVFKNLVQDLPIKRDSDWIGVDLSLYDIYISQDFFVAIEFIPNFKNPTIIDLGSILTKGKGYTRRNSFGQWSKLNGGAAINVEIEY